MDEDRPTPGIAEELSPGLRRVLADNPSPMTYWGTNTYLVGTRDIAVIDPGPDDAAHLAAILGALDTGQRVSHVLVTHSHVDHSPLAHRLARETGAQVHGFGLSHAGRSAIMTQLAASGLEDAGEGVDAGFAPDVALSDGMVIEAEGWALEALWTPGHLGNHMAFAVGDTVFCGDLVMGWASSLVAPPDGDLTDFMASCRRLRIRGAKVFHSGHGAPIQDPMGRLDWLLAHREGREASILDALRDGPADAQSLARRVYTDTPVALLGAAARNVLAHLIDLHGRNLVAPDGNLTATSRFELL
ncbi:Hydroxyacylglutathione hydrolase [Roseovarius sp. THAF9]|uniref:MBL fold metallo-hydrolase n=1 Tax=Roseovarius sp. THAF9 TaxID=2587847 RepID=UPI0012681877|nr:MBL fold metallo-hydrolase [Roseovarius sp. THAF9]QFT93192.1 Hydroxyacylglutathione hydrolase [Roseovarius sp. THAF9]